MPETLVGVPWSGAESWAGNYADHAGTTGMQVFIRSLAMVAIAELFDKTWFMGLLLALKYSPAIVFVGSFLALLLHCVLAAAFGFAFAKLLQPHILDFVAAGLFSMFAILYTRDCYNAEPGADAIAAGKEEAAEDVSISKDDPEEKDRSPKEASKREVDGAEQQVAANSYGAVKPKQKRSFSGMRAHGVVFMKSFMAVFIAEWGDRTQIAMVGQHASQPLVPVFMGSVAAFFLLTLSAVIVARILTDQKLSERLVHGVGAICFGIFAVLAFKDAFAALAHRRLAVSSLAASHQE